MKPPPPMLPAVGCVTASAKAVATAASMAVPPSCSTTAPILEAVSSCATTIPCFARTGDGFVSTPASRVALNSTAPNSWRFMQYSSASANYKPRPPSARLTHNHNHESPMSRVASVADRDAMVGWWHGATPAARRALVAASLGWMLDSFDVMLYALVLT